MRSWAGTWRGRPAAPAAAPEPTRTGPRIAVIGNCQAHGVAQALRLLLPEARVDLVPMAHLSRDHASLAGLKARLDGFDHVFSHFFPEGFVAGGNVHDLAAGDARLRLFPTILFPAYHPDMVYVGDVGALSAAGLVPSPIGPYHSAIALCGHLEGLGVAATLGLFEDAVFARLGYHDAWAGSAAQLLAGAADLGFGLEEELLRWSRRGCFMHGLNHPKLFVLADLARRLAREAGLAPLALAVEDYLPDDLVADVTWPVYPQVAARYGLVGSTLFKAKARPGAFPDLFDLERFVAASFAIYARHPPAGLINARVAAWRADAATRALFS